MRRNPTLEGIFGTLEWLIIAFSLTLVFIVFEMQAYTIPTGSMADTLKGAHFRLRCRQCGYRYDYDFLQRYYRLSDNATPRMDVPVLPVPARCPSCGYHFQSGEPMPVMKGDRIFVLKCIYQFVEPRQWDVVVFKNPLEPDINFIKRMVAGPGETIEIIDGDIYIDGKISRKPPKVQRELWMCVYDNDYQPVKPDTRVFNGGRWRQPFRNDAGSNWNFDSKSPAVFSLKSPVEQINTMVYDTRIGGGFRATHAYDYHAPRAPEMPICSDLMVRFNVRADGAGIVGAGLSKYGIQYEGRVDFSGRMVIEKIERGDKVILAGKTCRLPVTERGVRFRFANVDHQLILQLGDEKLVYDLGLSAGDAGERRTDIMPRVTIFGAGSLGLSHIAILRDIHYIDSTPNGTILRAGQGRPFELGEDEFFVLGDNTPASLDSRWWNQPGKGNNGNKFRQGIVPRDYLVGKAFFVYWPGAFKPFERFKLIPCVGGAKVIVGGTHGDN